MIAGLLQVHSKVLSVGVTSCCDLPMRENALVEFLEDAISRNVAIVLRENCRDRPVERLYELISQEAAGVPGAAPPSPTDAAQSNAEEIASQLGVAIRAAVLLVLRTKPTSSYKALVTLAAAINRHQSPKALASKVDEAPSEAEGSTNGGASPPFRRGASSRSQMVGADSQRVSFCSTTEVMSRVSVHSRH